ncbi:DUF4253 domain-containing protein [Chitinophaga sp. NPDC101104]|uniref:DUF4253 domain-containing protein n=1 Tax=Chitinophaga sp. NPDC101104 TaxID=3390561 RepID=UPI003CFC9E41
MRNRKMGINDFIRRLFGAPSAVPVLPANDLELANAVRFRPSVMQAIRRSTRAALYRLEAERTVAGPGNTVVTEVYRPDALLFKADQQDAGRIIQALRKELSGQGFLIFLSEQNFGHLPDEIGILKSGDTFDILRCKGTDAINYGIDNESLVATMKKWHAETPVEIVGAGPDWLEVRFLAQPDWNAMAEKVYALCPDAVDHGAGSIAALAAEMRETGMLYLWWD